MRRRLVLPFMKRPTDPAAWAYDHKVGLCVMIIVYLILGIAFISAKIDLSGTPDQHTIYMVMEELPEEEPLTPEEREALEEALRQVRNEISNEDARDEAENQLDRNSAIPEDLAKEAQEVADRLEASREAREKGLQEEQEMIEAHEAKRNQSQDNNAEKQKDVKVRGNVIVSFSLEGRTFVYMHKPAYQCEGGGEVVVAIEVTRNGDVRSASVESASTSDPCMLDRAVDAAKRSTFNVSSSAPERQQGTITYLFIPQ